MIRKENNTVTPKEGMNIVSSKRTICVFEGEL